MDYYGSISGGYDELYGAEQSKKLEIIKEKIKLDKTARVLDVGCGTGISSRLDCFVAGIDSSIGLLGLNSTRIKVFGAAECLPFKDGSFDCVISVTAMHNFDDPAQSLGEIARVGKRRFVFSILKKSGKFEAINNLIKERFEVTDMVDEGRDMIFFCRNRPQSL